MATKYSAAPETPAQPNNAIEKATCAFMPAERSGDEHLFQEGKSGQGQTGKLAVELDPAGKSTTFEA
jgi:hypothetical protein